MKSLNKKIYIQKFSIKKLSSILFFFTLFLIILDPTRSVFHMTEIVFCFFFLVNMDKLEYSYFPIIVYFFCIFFLSSSFSFCLQPIDENRLFSQFIALFFLIFLLFSNDNRKIFFKYFYICCLIMSYIVIFLWLFFMIVGKYTVLIQEIFLDTGPIIFSSSKRFLSLLLVSVFYRTSPIIVLPFSIALSYGLKNKNKKVLLHALIFFMNLFISATRANILSVLLLLFFIFFFHVFYNMKYVNLGGGLLAVALLLAFILIFMILSKKDGSSNVKSLHIESEFELFQTNYFRTFFIGFGPGQLFYTKGWNKMVSLCEVSYFELIRNYGLLFGGGIIIIYLYPLFLLFQRNNYLFYYKVSIGLSYCAYLFIAGTNPFLMSMIAYLFISEFFYLANNNVLVELYEKKREIK